jgi:hypothetical protein
MDTENTNFHKSREKTNQSQLGCIVPGSIKPELSVHSEGSKQCIVLGYDKNKLKDCDNNILMPGSL